MSERISRLSALLAAYALTLSRTGPGTLASGTDLARRVPRIRGTGFLGGCCCLLVVLVVVVIVLLVQRSRRRPPGPGEPPA